MYVHICIVCYPCGVTINDDDDSVVHSSLAAEWMPMLSNCTSFIMEDTEKKVIKQLLSRNCSALHDLCACGRHTVSYWSTHGSDDSLAGYQATAATTEELTADCCDRQRQSSW